ncbi:MAG: methyltransferase [Helicobacteraceae bacterium]|nr:methyltransferase [Helicobacteraceae bacterium]
MLLYQPQNGYCYNSDSLFLYDFISSFNPKGKVLEVGSGCGVIGLLVARDHEKVELSAVEKQDEFFFLSKKNAEVNTIKYNITQGDFLEFDSSTEFEYIISNPPFYHDGVTKCENNMIHTARYNEHLPMGKFFKKVASLLKPKAHFIFCYDAKQFGEICVELNSAKLRVVDVQFVHSKADRSASLVLVHARANSASLMNIKEPFITFENDEFSTRVKNIYEKARTHTLKCQV